MPAGTHKDQHLGILIVIDVVTTNVGAELWGNVDEAHSKMTRNFALRDDALTQIQCLSIARQLPRVITRGKRPAIFLIVINEL